jgi:hypothetical protein
MSQIVEIPGIGSTEFPDEMPPEAIKAKVHELIGRAKAVEPSTPEIARQAEADPATAAKVAKISQIQDPEERRRASEELAESNLPTPFRQAAALGREARKAMSSPEEYLVKGVEPGTQDPNVVQRIVRGGLQGATLGFSDEAAAAIAAATGQDYETVRDEIRAKNEAAQAASGGEYGASMLAGSLLPVIATAGAAGPAAAPAVAPTVLGTAARGAGFGAGFGGLQGLGHSKEDVVSDTAKGAALGSLLGGAGGTVAGLARKLSMSVPAIKAWLERQAGQQAIKGLGATRVDVAKLDNPARGGVPGTAAKIGREALKEGVPLSDPQAAAAATKAMKAEAGARMGAVKAAPEAETAVDFPAFSDAVKNDVIKPMLRPETPQFQPTALKVREWLDRLTMGMLQKRAAAEGKAVIRAFDLEKPEAVATAKSAFEAIAGPGVRPKWQVISDDPAQSLGRLSIEEAHQIRQGLDELTKAYGIPSESTPAMKEALIAARNKLAEQMTVGAESIGKGPEWMAANAAFRDAAKLNRIAARGAERQAGNDVIGLPETVAAAGGLSHGPAGGIFAGLADKMLRVKGPEWMAKGAFGAAERLPDVARAIQAPTATATAYGPSEIVAATKTGEPAGPDPVKVLADALDSGRLGPYTADVAARRKEGGPEAVARWHYLQSAKDPQYRAMLKGLSQTGAAQ